MVCLIFGLAVGRPVDDFTVGRLVEDLTVGRFVEGFDVGDFVDGAGVGAVVSGVPDRMQLYPSAAREMCSLYPNL